MLLLALGWLGGGNYLLQIARRLRPTWRRLLLVAICLLPLVSLGSHWQAIDLHDDWSVHAYIYQALDGIEPGGLVIVRGDGPTFALWYGIYAEEQRPDVAVVSGPLLAYIWYRDHVRHFYPDLILHEPTADGVTTDDLVHDLIDSNRDRRPVYATDPSEPWKVWFDFVKQGDAPVYRAYPRQGS
jgi:hypothetical protein